MGKLTTYTLIAHDDDTIDRNFSDLGSEKNAWWDNIISDNSMVSEWKENFRLPQPNSSLLGGGGGGGGGHFVSYCLEKKHLVNHFIMNISSWSCPCV